MPDVVDVKPAALWYGVVLDDLDGFSNSFGMPVWNPYWNRCDEAAVIPVDTMQALCSLTLVSRFLPLPPM